MIQSKISESLVEYYINFLETSFKKERTPNRRFTGKSSTLKINDDFLVLKNSILNLCTHSSDSENYVRSFAIKKGKYQIQSKKNKLQYLVAGIDKFFNNEGKLIKPYLVIKELGIDDELLIDKLSECESWNECFSVLVNTGYREKLIELRNSHFLDDGALATGPVSYYIGDDAGNKIFIDADNEYHPMVNYIYHEAGEILSEKERLILSGMDRLDEVEDFIKTFKDLDFFNSLQDIDKDSRSSEKYNVFLNFFELKLTDIETKKTNSFPLFSCECDLDYKSSNQGSSFDIKLDEKISINRNLIRYLTQKCEGGIDWSIPPSEMNLFMGENLIHDMQETIQDLLNKIQAQEQFNFSIPFTAQKIKFRKNFNITGFGKKTHKAIYEIELNTNFSFSIDEKDFILVDPKELPVNERKDIESYVYHAIDDAVNSNPESYHYIEKEVQEMDFHERLSYESPIPINAQQMQILRALDTPGCDKIVVEGPPGTGKSHSIVAILQHCIFNDKKVLFVSDKKEALDVVEEKINKVFDADIGAPIVRIGSKAGEANFRRLFSPSYVNALKDHLNNFSTRSDESGELKSKINQYLQKEVSLVEEKVASNLTNIKFYIENEPKVKDVFESLFADSDLKNRSAIIPYINSLLIIQSLDINAYNDLSLSDIETLPIVEESKLLKTIASEIEKVKTTAFDMIDYEELFLANLTNHDSFTSQKNAYNSDFGAEALEIIELHYQHHDFSTLDSVQSLLEWLYNIYEITGEVYVDRIKLIDLRDIKNEQGIDELDILLNELHSKQGSFFGLGNALNTRKIKKIQQEIDRLLPHSNLKLDQDVVSRLISEDLYELKKILSICKSRNINFHKFCKELEYIKKNELSLDFMERREKFLKIQDFADYHITSLGGYNKLGYIFESIGNINKSHQKIESIFFRDSGRFINIDIVKYLDTISLDNLGSTTLQVYCDNLLKLQNDIKKKQDALDQLVEFSQNYNILDLVHSLKKNTNSMNMLSVNTDSLWSFENVPKVNKKDFEIVKKYVDISDDIQGLIDFYKKPRSYFEDKKNLENIEANKLFKTIAGRFIKYYRDHKNDVSTIKKIFSGKISMNDDGRERILELLQNFLITIGVVIVNIRDIFKYLPLKKNLFDVIVIDEASQVSIGQSFMLLPMAKKAVVLGDRKQYPNLKATHADASIDNYYFEKIYRLGKNNLERSKLEIFKVRNSILDYMKQSANFEVMLRNHFRSYEDLIHFSNHNFYEGSLIVPKIRTKAIEDTIKFDYLDVNRRTPTFNNTNQGEIDHIVELLRDLKVKNYRGSIGILTPSSNQQKSIQETIYGLSDLHEWFYDEREGIVSTFDTCQGQEKDYIIYSMVTDGGGSAKGSGNLTYIFPASFTPNPGTVDIRTARLNVGFSRAKEVVHFVLSTSINNIGGSIGTALRSFESRLTNVVDESDLESEAEKKLIGRIKNTEFYTEHYGDFNIIPQFNIGEYLQQINNTFVPKYRVDFLCTIKKGQTIKTFIIEYDGFEYHFEKGVDVNKYNYSRHYIEKDIERQKIIEYYGYEFLRYNKFNLGENPILKIHNDLSQIYDNLEGEDPEIDEDNKPTLNSTVDPEKTMINIVGRLGRLESLYNIARNISETIPLNSLIDYNSGMESILIDMIKKTDFFINHKENFLIVPQFPIGIYLNKSKGSTLPTYKCDFLCCYMDKTNEKYLIIEYDGHERHYENGDNINQKDRLRQNNIEKYGFDFLRYNRDNLKVDPVSTINQDLERFFLEQSNQQHHISQGTGNKHRDQLNEKINSAKIQNRGVNNQVKKMNKVTKENGMGVNAAINALGITKKDLNKLVADGKISAKQIGSKIYYNKQDIVDLI